MPSRLRVAIVGLGFGERVLVPAFQADARCEVVGLCASRYERARDAAARLQIGHAYRTWQEAVDDPEVDAIAVATPPSLHAEIALAALRNKRHVFCEKPLAATEQSAALMRDAAAEAGTANMIDFEFPEIPEWQRARQIIAAGELGRVRHAAVSWYRETYASRTRDDSWKTRPAEGGGALNTFVCHCFYYLEWLLGPIRTIWAAPQGEDAADTLVILALQLNDGARVSVSVGTAAFLGDGHALTVYGDEGTLALTNRTHDLAAGFQLWMGTRSTGERSLVPVEPFTARWSDGRVAAVNRLVSRFVTWAIDGQPSHPDFADGFRVQTLLDAAWRARRDGIAAPHDLVVR